MSVIHQRLLIWTFPFVLSWTCMKGKTLVCERCTGEFSQRLEERVQKGTGVLDEGWWKLDHVLHFFFKSLFSFLFSFFSFLFFSFFLFLFFCVCLFSLQEGCGSVPFLSNAPAATPLLNVDERNWTESSFMTHQQQQQQQPLGGVGVATRGPWFPPPPPLGYWPPPSQVFTIVIKTCPSPFPSPFFL